MLGAIELIQLFSVCKQLSILKVLAKDRLVVEKDVEAHLGGLSEKNWVWADTVTGTSLVGRSWPIANLFGSENP